MNIDELSIEELNNLFDEKEIDLENIKNAIDRLLKAKNDINDIKSCNDIYEMIENAIAALGEEQDSIENELEEINDQIDYLEQYDPDENKYLEKEYWASQF